MYNIFIMSGSLKEKKEIYITRSLELLIWLIIVCIVVLTLFIGVNFKEHNDTNDYQVFLPDVDGLIVGSPVRMMGIQVGHVVKIKPIKDEVYVKFILTNPDVYIPQGTSLTVEFSGLAGSKSLELYLPDKKDSLEAASSVIAVQPPKRLHDALSLLNDMFKKIGSIMYSTSSFGTKLQESDIMSFDFVTEVSSKKDFIKYSNKFLDDSNKKVMDIKNSLGEFKKNVKPLQ